MPLLTRLRELPWYVQFLIFLLVAGLVFLAGEMLPQSPVKQKLDERKQKEQELARLIDQVAVLQETKRRYDEFKAKVEAARQQLLLSKAVVPDEKRTDDFIRSIQQAGLDSQVSIRRLTAKPVAAEQFYTKMPVEIQIDGGYYGLLDFYERLSRLTRVVNVGELKLDSGEGKGAAGKVLATSTLTTYYTTPEAEMAAAGPAGAPARPAAGTPPR